METNDSYTFRVEAGDWPDDPSVPLDEPFVDERGSIQNLVLRPVGGTAVIFSKAGTVRSNHYHKTDWHYIYVASGRVLYYERDAGSDAMPEPRRYGPGDMFFTPPMREHCVAFLDDSVIFTMSRNPRSHEGHEADLVRVQFVDPKDVDWT